MIEIIGLIGAILLLIVIIRWVDFCDTLWGRIVTTTILGVLINALVLCLYLVIAYNILEAAKENKVDHSKTETVQLYNIINNDTYTGSFSIGGFLTIIRGDGELKAVEKYYAFVKNQNGNLVRKYFEVDKTEIIMSGNNRHLETWRKYTYIEPGFWSIAKIQTVSEEIYYKLYIPKNSIIEKVNIQ